MAERRMFSRSVIGSARFLRMPATSRLLYYDLGMEADDDGCVEAFGVMRKTGATEDDLRVLASKGFIRVLNEDLVSYILDWNINNQIRKDRYHESRYKGLIGSSCNVILEAGYKMETSGLPDVNQMEPEVRLGKVSIGKDSIEGADKPLPTPEAASDKKAPKHKYGEYKNVLLSDDELNKLRSEIPGCENLIERLSEYIASTGKKYKSHYATIRSWAKRELKAGRPVQSFLEDDLQGII